MLTKRTNILFDQELWKKLITMSRKQSVSIGKLVRDAVRSTYFHHEKKTTRAQVFEQIRQIRPKPLPGRLDYKELINDGRKY